MIDLYYFPTPNTWKVSIMLEECGLPYTLKPVNITRGEQFEPAFLRISPNNRVPAIVDHAPPSAFGDEPLSLFESGAILIYLAEKTGQFLPEDPRQRYRTLQWLQWQMGGLGPMAGQYNHFKMVAPPNEYALTRYTNEVRRLYGIMDGELKSHPYLAGDAYTIADMACWGWVSLYELQELDLTPFSSLWDWYQRVAARAAVQRGRAAGKSLFENAPPPSEEDRQRLYNPRPDR
ncbi:MAG: glutathione S-transferase N-terminal domain-containing protein [Gammaproteobacteria bacterium]|nr:glutathione S-transferase N-terminal domain-containing protein [Gammaproteobacteria bacterium]